ncbi:hypothetical protein NMW79_00895 [Pasteurella multocida]|nr:hypothetical protein [Pasteurella multocida]
MNNLLEPTFDNLLKAYTNGYPVYIEGSTEKHYIKDFDPSSWGEAFLVRKVNASVNQYWVNLNGKYERLNSPNNSHPNPTNITGIQPLEPATFVVMTRHEADKPQQSTYDTIVDIAQGQVDNIIYIDRSSPVKTEVFESIEQHHLLVVTLDAFEPTLSTLSLTLFDEIRPLTKTFVTVLDSTPLPLPKPAFDLSAIVDDVINNHTALRLRNSNKAYLSYSTNEIQYPLKGVRINADGHTSFETWSTNGEWDVGTRNSFDIVGLWEEDE